MKQINFETLSYYELEEMYFHLTNEKRENSISDKGLNAEIGDNSKGILGKEKNPKVFFTKGVIGTLEYINRVFNIAAKLLKGNASYDDILKDIPLDYIPYLPSREEYMQMTCDERVMYFCENYFSNSMYLSLDLEEGKDFQLECEDEKSGKVVKQDRSNMHTAPNIGVSKDKISKAFINGSSNVIEIVNFLSEKYLSQYNVKTLPTKSKFDKDYLSDYLRRYKEKCKENSFMSEFKDMSYKDGEYELDIKSEKEDCEKEI